MKKLLVILSSAVAVCIIVFVAFVYFYKEKINFIPINTLTEALTKKAVLQNKVEGMESFVLESGMCNITAKIYGKESVQKLEFIVFVKLPPIAITKEEERQEKTKCLQFAIKTLIIAFEEKRIKQEMIKASVTMFKQIAEKGSFEGSFFNKKLTAHLQEGNLVIALK